MPQKKQSAKNKSTKFKTPGDRPIYRLLTGVDDRAFCERVSESIELGWELYGSPAITFNSKTKTNIVAQGLIWPAALKKKKK